MLDFDKSDGGKTVVPESSRLGIRSTINRTLDSHEDTLHSEARKLFESMNVTEKIIQALDNGQTSVNIPFPAKLVPENRFIGKYRWSDVANILVELIKSEGVPAHYTTKETLGGCCKYPLNLNRNQICNYCQKNYKKHNTKTLSLLVLQGLK
jgi:hypothetical protein